jgi:hypothetical protein
VDRRATLRSDGQRRRGDVLHVGLQQVRQRRSSQRLDRQTEQGRGQIRARVVVAALARRIAAGVVRYDAEQSEGDRRGEVRLDRTRLQQRAASTLRRERMRW